MRNHKFSTATWVIANYLLAVVFLALLREPSMQQQSIYITFAFLYFFIFCIFWGALQNHIRLSYESQNIEPPKSAGAVGFFNELCRDTLNFAPTFALSVPLYYWMFRIVLLLVIWLKTGEWSEFTTCDVYKQFCYFDSNAIGLNILMNKVGQADFGFLLTAMCFLIYFVSKLTKNLNSDD